MRLTEDMELLEGLPVAYVKSLNSLVISDLHLGYEGLMAKRGTLVPKVNMMRILETIRSALSLTGADRIIVNGDIKNEFSKVDVEEFNELYDFITFAKKMGAKLTLIKGNHDNFVDRYREPFGLEIFEEHSQIGDYFFFHGETAPKDVPKCKMMIMGHEHPTISIYNSTGRRDRIRCFLYGKYGRVPLLVLPAIGYFSTGNDVNFDSSRMLSPVFKKVKVESMHALACGFGSTLDFGVISKLRRIQD
jgi:hypothetical protein